MNEDEHAAGDAGHVFVSAKNFKSTQTAIISAVSDLSTTKLNLSIS